MFPSLYSKLIVVWSPQAGSADAFKFLFNMAIVSTAPIQDALTALCAKMAAEKGMLGLTPDHVW